MPTNEFLPFATGIGANVLSQADYAALGSRGTGFVAGTALSAPFNKAVRQSSVAASMVAQYSADLTGANVADDGDVSSILNVFKAAVRSQKLNYLAVGGTSTALSITLTPAPTSWADLVGVPLRLLMASAAGTPATLAVAGLTGTKSIVKRGGSPVLPSEWLAGDIVECVYDGTVVRMVSSQRLGLDSGGFSSYGANVSIPVSDIGKVVNLNLACRSAILPRASDCASGIMILHNTTPGYMVTVSAQAGDDITLADKGTGSGLTSFNLAHGESAIIGSWAPYSNNWAVMAGSAHDRYTPQAYSVLSALVGGPSYKRIPDATSPTGYILFQSGTKTLVAAQTLEQIVFPVAFPNRLLGIYASSSEPTGYCGATNNANSVVDAWVHHSAAGSTVWWFAWGY